MKFNKLIDRVKFAFVADDVVLNPYTGCHWSAIEKMKESLYEIWEYSKKGNAEACAFMHSKLHDRLVQFRLDFGNVDIPELHKRATYGEYKSIMAEVNPILRRVRKEKAAA